MAECLKLGGSPTDEHGLPWRVLSTEELTLADNQQASIHGEFVLEGTVILKDSAQLVIEN